MGRDTQTKCKKCRRERTKLFLKGEKCYSDKCPMESRPYPPGESGGGRSRYSQYRTRLREKQKARHIYGLREEKFSQYIKEAKEGKEVTGDYLVQTLESRLDNVLYRGGLASSRDQARQMINHGHLKVNGRPLDNPSYLVKVDDEIEFRDNSRSKQGIKNILTENEGRDLPEWLSVGTEETGIVVIGEPDPEEIKESLQVNLIVEFYSR